MAKVAMTNKLRVEWSRITVILHREINKLAKCLELLPVPSKSATLISVDLELCDYIMQEKSHAQLLIIRVKDDDFFLLMNSF